MDFIFVNNILENKIEERFYKSETSGCDFHWQFSGDSWCGTSFMGKEQGHVCSWVQRRLEPFVLCCDRPNIRVLDPPFRPRTAALAMCGLVVVG